MLINISRFRKNAYWYWLFTMLPFLVPDIFLRSVFIKTTIEVATFIIFISYCLKLISKRGLYISGTRMIIVVFYLSLLISTIINKGAIGDAVIHVVKVIIICMIFETVSVDKNEFILLLHAVRDIIVFFFIINIIVSIIYPMGLPEYSHNNIPVFIYGNVNVTERCIFPGIVASAYLDNDENRVSFKTIFLIFGFFFLCFHVYMMATGLISVLFFLCWLVFRRILMKNCLKVYIVFLSTIVFIELTVVVFYNNMSFISFVSNIFGKDAKFSNRYYLWYSAIRHIKEKIVFGYGALTKDEMRGLVGNPSGSHNYYLDVFLRQGIIGIGILLIMILIPLIVLMNNKKIINSKKYILMGASISILLLFLGEPVYEKEHLIITVFYMYVVSAKRSNVSEKLLI